MGCFTSEGCKVNPLPWRWELFPLTMRVVLPILSVPEPWVELGVSVPMASPPSGLPSAQGPTESVWHDGATQRMLERPGQALGPFSLGP